MRRAANRDANHRAIVCALRERGYAVTDLGTAGRGIPDLFVSRDGRGCLVEVKRPDRVHLRLDPASSEGRSRGRQAAFRELHAGVVCVATSADDVDRWFAKGLEPGGDPQQEVSG